MKSQNQNVLYLTNIQGEQKMACIALLTAGGTATRMNQDIPKQFLCVNNKPIIIYTLEAFQHHPNIDEIYVAILDGWTHILWAYAKQYNITKLKQVVLGGATGHDSIFNGLKAIHDNHSNDDIVIIHDGNRPLVSQDIITDSLVKQKEYGSAVAAIPCTEVVFVSENKTDSLKTISRDNLLRTQTPHVYTLGNIWDAYLQAREKGISNTAAACELMSRLGKPTFFSKGSEKNIKITTVDDIDLFEAYLKGDRNNALK